MCLLPMQDCSAILHGDSAWDIVDRITDVFFSIGARSEKLPEASAADHMAYVFRRIFSVNLEPCVSHPLNYCIDWTIVVFQPHLRTSQLLQTTTVQF